jgi:hypothetical protein
MLKSFWTACKFNEFFLLCVSVEFLVSRIEEFLVGNSSFFIFVSKAEILGKFVVWL